MFSFLGIYLDLAFAFLDCHTYTDVLYGDYFLPVKLESEVYD